MSLQISETIQYISSCADIVQGVPEGILKQGNAVLCQKYTQLTILSCKFQLKCFSWLLLVSLLITRFWITALSLLIYPILIFSRNYRD